MRARGGVAAGAVLFLSREDEGWRMPEELDLRAAAAEGNVVHVGCQVYGLFEGRLFLGSAHWDDRGWIRTDEDPTTALIAVAHANHEFLGEVVGDMRMAGHDVTRWEVLAAPFAVHLEPALADRLAAAWSPRAPGLVTPPPAGWTRPS